MKMQLSTYRDTTCRDLGGRREVRKIYAGYAAFSPADRADLRGECGIYFRQIAQVREFDLRKSARPAGDFSEVARGTVPWR